MNAPETQVDEVDLTLVDWMLRLSPRERLLENDRTVRLMEKLRNAREVLPHGNRPDEPAGTSD